MKPDVETWKSQNSLLSWIFSIAPVTGSAQDDLQTTFLRAMTACAGFAEFDSVEWATNSEGEEAAELASPSEVNGVAVTRVFSNLADVYEVQSTLNLLCRAPDGEFTLRHGAYLNLRHTGAGAMHLDLVLHVDIYAPYTNAGTVDNRELSALNAPRLASFLGAVLDQLGGKLQHLDAPGYTQYVNERGFCFPEKP